MYVIDALKKEFPNLAEIDVYDAYLHKHFSEDALNVVFTSEKKFYQYLRHAFAALEQNNHGRYNQYMCMFNKALNNDADFLRIFILDMFGDKNDYSTATVEELQRIINKHYGEEASSI